MKFYKPVDFKVLTNRLKPEDFLQDMVKCGELDSISGKYSDDCSLLCHNAVAWLIQKMLKDNKLAPYLYQIEIAVGNFNGKEHTWMIIGDFYFDYTLAQFIEDAPPVAITKIVEAEGYKPEEKMSFFEWCQKKSCGL